MDSSKSDNQETITGPLVFSCSGCKTIVGDSYSFMCSNEQLKSITLSAANNIERSADVYTSKGGYDVGSTYFTFSCSSCHTPIERYYLTTSKDLDEIREKFTFFIDNLNTYEIGKSKFGKIPDPEVITFADTSKSNIDISVAAKYSLSDVMAEMLKVNKTSPFSLFKT